MVARWFRSLLPERFAVDLDGEPKIGVPKLFFEGEYVNVWGHHMIRFLTVGFCC